MSRLIVWVLLLMLAICLTFHETPMTTDYCWSMIVLLFWIGLVASWCYPSTSRVGEMEERLNALELRMAQPTNPSTIVPPKKLVYFHPPGEKS